MTYVSGLNYTTYVSQIANLTAISSNDSNFQTMLPGMINDAEQRIYREADFLANYCYDTSTNVQANNIQFFLPTSQGYFLTIDAINIFTPVGAGLSSGVRNPLVPTTKQFIYTVYPSAATSVGVPTYFARLDDLSLVFGPTPDQAYNIEVVGTQRPPALSAANSSTFLTQVLPDLFIAASMVFAAGYMRNFGAQADNPQMSESWESHYQNLFKSAITEEFRKKFQSQGWQQELPDPNVSRV